MVDQKDKDLELKLRFRRLLFLQGYWTPIEVELSQYEDLGTSIKRRSLTDLDVLGIKYDELFAANRIVGDCKSGKNVSDVSRLFWLKGVKDYFGADQAYLIHSTVDNHARGIAPKLGLRILDTEGLTLLEKAIPISELQIPLADVTIHEKITSEWGIKVTKDNKPSEQQLLIKEVFSYLSYSYWYIEQYRNPLTLVDHFIRVASVLNETDKSHSLLAYSGLERFAHSLLEVCAYISAQGGVSLPVHTRHYLFGGVLSLREKEEFFRLLRKLTKSNEYLDPPFLPEIIELLGRMFRNPQGAKDVLRFIYAVYFWNVHMGKATPPLLRKDEKDNIPIIVLARDMVVTFTKITGVKTSLYSAITKF